MIKRVLAVDVETTKAPVLHPWQKEAALVAVGIADLEGRTKTWLFNHNDLKQKVSQRKLIAEIQEEIDGADLLVGHNLKFDLNWLRFIGIKFTHQRFFCTQITEYLLRGQRGKGELHLSDLSRKYLSVMKKDVVKLYWEAGYETTEIPLKILLPYLEQDCINSLAIYQRQRPKVISEGMTALVGVQNALVPILSDMESNGIGWDQETAQRHVLELSAKLKDINGNLRVLFDFDYNLDSRDELSVALFGGKIRRPGMEWVTRELKHETLYYERKCVVETDRKGAGFRPQKYAALKKEGYYSTDKNNLEQLRCRADKQRQIKTFLLERSIHKKALETLLGKNEDGEKGLINKVQADGRIHGSFNQSVTKTGRLSSSAPNLQNQPRKKTSPIKQCFVSRNGKLVSLDLAQIEWRVCGHLCQDPTMLREIRTGVDAHRENAIYIFKANTADADFDDVRTVAKICTFRLIYGGSAYGFYMDQKMPSYTLARWEEIVEGFYRKYPGLKTWQEKQIAKVYETGGILRNPTGRKFVFKKGDDERKPDEYAVRQIKNWPVQSLATADIMPLAMVIIAKKYKQMGLRSLWVGQVHDNLIWDAFPEEIEPIVRMGLGVFENLPQYIERVFGFKMTVPISGDAEIGGSWSTLEKHIFNSDGKLVPKEQRV